MRLQQQMRPEYQLLTPEVCDFGIVPLPQTGYGIDFVLGDGKIIPIVTLFQPAGIKRRIMFNVGFELEDLRTEFSTITEAARSASVRFCSEDPTDSMLIVTVSIGARYVEMPLIGDFSPLFSFPYEADEEAECGREEADLIDLPPVEYGYHSRRYLYDDEY